MVADESSHATAPSPDEPIADERLRSALEFAVGIAAAGAKVRPPLAFPAALRPFLRFHKLPARALAEVRAAVVSDDDFRRRLGSVATEELVDRAGWLWLARPDGWQVQLAEAPAGLANGDSADAAREVKRRRAAEAAAARAQAELLRAEQTISELRGRHEELSAEVTRLEGQLGDLRRRLRTAQQAEERSRARAEAAESHVAPSPPPMAAPSSARVEVDVDLLADINRAGAALAAAERAMQHALDRASGRNAAPVSEQRAARMPVRLRRGVRADSVEAAEQLLRTVGATILVDGYNVAKLGWPSLALDDQRRQAIDAVADLGARLGFSATIVFDGADVPGAHRGRGRGVRVVYSPAGVAADDVIRATVRTTEAAVPVVVVTSDNAIRHDVAALGANLISSPTLLAVRR